MNMHRRDFIRAAALSAGTAMIGLRPRDALADPAPGLGEVRNFLGGFGPSKVALPPVTDARPLLNWAGPLSKSVPTTTLPAGVVIPVSDPAIGGPVRRLLSASIPGSPKIGGLPCLGVIRSYLCEGTVRSVSSPLILRFRTDAPVVELSGVVPDGGRASVTLIVDGQLVPAAVLSSSLGMGGWCFGTFRIDFGSRRIRDVWLETSANLAHLKINSSDTLYPVDDAAEPQLTVVGDSFLQVPTGNFGNGAGIALELAARLGMRKVAVDAVGGTGYINSGGGLGSLNDRLVGHAADNSSIYLVMAGLNDYGNITASRAIDWGSRAAYENSVSGYLQRLRAARPGAVIAVTAPLCPNPTLSDATYVVNPAVNSSGLGDSLYKAAVHRQAVSAISPPWVYIDALMGTGWLNSSGARGDVTNLQWFTGGTPAAGTSSANRPGNTAGGGGGGFGGIAGVPVLQGGSYRQAPEIAAYGGTGSGLLLASTIDRSGRLTSIRVSAPGVGYRAGAGMPIVVIDRSFEIQPATLGAPELIVGINPNGAYPLPSFAPAGVAPHQLNNIFTLLAKDKVHPSPAGASYLAARLAQNLFDAIMAL